MLEDLVKVSFKVRQVSWRSRFSNVKGLSSKVNFWLLPYEMLSGNENICFSLKRFVSVITNSE